MIEERRKFLKQMGALFASGAAIASGVKVVNEELRDGKFVTPKKSVSHGLYVISYGVISGSRDFPIRPVGSICQDGQLIWFVWPSEKGEARGYVRKFDEVGVENLDLIVHRIRQGKPEAPYYLYWRRGDYFMYKTPGALVKRASYLIHRGESESEILQGLSDFRFAAILNAVFSGPEKSERIMNSLADIDNELRRGLMEIKDFSGFVEAYKEVLTFSREK